VKIEAAERNSVVSFRINIIVNMSDDGLPDGTLFRPESALTSAHFGLSTTEYPIGLIGARLK
jgi:hypothetical protein